MATEQVPDVARDRALERYMAAYRRRGEIVKARETEDASAPRAEREMARSINVEAAERPAAEDLAADTDDLRRELAAKEEELNRVKNDFQIKMRNTIALQRIKYEKELNDMGRKLEQYSEFKKAEEYIRVKEDEMDKSRLELKKKMAEVEDLRGKLMRAQAGEGVVGAAVLGLTSAEVQAMEDELRQARMKLEEFRDMYSREEKRRAEIESELENLKKGSIAMMKYVTNLQRKKHDEEIESLKETVHEEETRRKTLEEQVGNLERELVEKKEALARAPAGPQAVAGRPVSVRGGSADVEAVRRQEAELAEVRAKLEAKERELAARKRELDEGFQRMREERELRREEADSKFNQELGKLPEMQKLIVERDDAIKTMRVEMEAREDELRKLKNLVKYKDEEFNRRQEELDYKQKVVDQHLRKLQEARQAEGSLEQVEMKKRLQQLEREIAAKEEEMKTKESFLRQKEAQLRIREEHAVREDVDMRKKEVELELKARKVKTGAPRLDDLLFGGYPVGSNTLLSGPAFIGKEVLAYSFIVEGLQKGVPCVMVLTDVAPANVKEELSALLPSVDEYEKLGLLRWVDCYSKAMGESEDNPNTTYIDHPTDYKAIMEALEMTIERWVREEKHPTYRMGVLSISTFITYSDVTATFRFLQMMTGKNKMRRGVALYLIDEAMHSQTDLANLAHAMDGSIQVKTEGTKNYIRIVGVTDVQNRGWVSYEYSRKGLNIGSFSLDKIR
ncbi:MAG TPA: ATPase domain-containing protein [Candidatus Thermoplasmatota archaeon]